MMNSGVARWTSVMGLGDEAMRNEGMRMRTDVDNMTESLVLEVDDGGGMGR